MSKVEDLKNYLVGSDNSFLFNEQHNGKTIMLSGAWGAGKTFFWKEEIEPILSSSLKKEGKACVYISLYGKENLESIKNEVLYKSHLSSLVGESKTELTQKAISVFGLGSRILSSVSIMGVKVDPSAAVDSYSSSVEIKKLLDGEQYITNGGVICLDDFERKSKNIDLNDLFGFISQLSVEMNCKVVVILNSDVFEGEENVIFKRVKEKTVSKFFDFNPSINELFEVIFSNEKYTGLDKYKETILEAIKETKELNARIYIQVFDNCLEWILSDKSNDALRTLILCTVNFVKNHFVFDTFELQGGDTTFKVIEPFMEYTELGDFLKNRLPEQQRIGSDEIIHIIKSSINKQGPSTKSSKSPDYHQKQNKMLSDNKELVQAFYHYKYKLNIDDGISDELFQQVNNFVKSGILI